MVNPEALHLEDLQASLPATWPFHQILQNKLPLPELDTW